MGYKRMMKERILWRGNHTFEIKMIFNIDMGTASVSRFHNYFTFILHNVNL